MTTGATPTKVIVLSAIIILIITSLTLIYGTSYGHMHKINSGGSGGVPDSGLRFSVDNIINHTHTLR